jgi:hypothetical protein
LRRRCRGSERASVVANLALSVDRISSSSWRRRASTGEGGPGVTSPYSPRRTTDAQAELLKLSSTWPDHSVTISRSVPRIWGRDPDRAGQRSAACRLASRRSTALLDGARQLCRILYRADVPHEAKRVPLAPRLRDLVAFVAVDPDARDRLSPLSPVGDWPMNSFSKVPSALQGGLPCHRRRTHPRP